MTIPLPGLPLRLLTAGVGLPDPANPHNWRTTRRDYLLTGPGGIRSRLRLRVWSTRLPA